MGPPPFGSGNRQDSPLDLQELEDLQWGHRLSAVETPTLVLSIR